MRSSELMRRLRGGTAAGLCALLFLPATAAAATGSDPHAAPVTAGHAAEPTHAAAPAHGAADGAMTGSVAGVTPVTGEALPGTGPAEGAGYEGLAIYDGADAWTRWHLALEQTVAAGAQAEAAPLYPLDARAQAPATAQPYRHLAIAKAVTQLESKPAPAAGRDGGHGGGHGEVADAHGGGESPLLALANARNYLNLSEYDLALEWYQKAGAADAAGHFRRETGREALAAAICARDTVAAGRAIAATMTAYDLAGREAEFVLAMRWLLSRGDAGTLAWFVDRATAPELAADLRVSFWRAYSLSWLDRRAECLAELRRLLDMGGRERVLAPRERGWVLTAYADLVLLEGGRDEAEMRYRALSASALPAVRDWGRLQAAGIAFVANRYGEAAAAYREICQAETKGAWNEHACAMADIAAQLERLLSEGERYGAAAHYGH